MDLLTKQQIDRELDKSLRKSRPVSPYTSYTSVVPGVLTGIGVVQLFLDHNTKIGITLIVIGLLLSAFFVLRVLGRWRKIVDKQK